MTSLRRTAAFAVLALAAVAGCQSNKPTWSADAGAPTADRVAAARAAYTARGDLVGVVDDANEKYAAVSGVDPAIVKKGDAFSFIDVGSNAVVSTGTLSDTSAAGRLIVEYD